MEVKEIKKVKLKLVLTILSVFLPVVFLIVFDLPFIKENFVVYKDLVVLRYVIFSLLELYVGYRIYKYARFIFDENYNEQVSLRKNDERLNFIKLKTIAFVFKAFIYIGGVALVAAGFFNAFVFYTLLIVMGVILLLYLLAYVYFSKKY